MRYGQLSALEVVMIDISVRVRQELRSPHREPNPPCQHCRSALHVTGVLRTDLVIYFRCSTCGSIRSLPKPELVQPGRDERVLKNQPHPLKIGELVMTTARTP